MLAGGVVDVFGAHGDAGIEFIQRVGFFFQPVRLKDIKHLLHGLRDRVVAGEAVIFEEGVKNWLGDEVLGEHLDDFAIGDGVVEVVPEFVGEGFEGGDFLGVLRVADNLGDAGNVSLGDLGDVVGPIFPVVPVTAFLDDFGVEGAFQFADVEGELGLSFGHDGNFRLSHGVSPCFASAFQQPTMRAASSTLSWLFSSLRRFWRRALTWASSMVRTRTL